MKRTTDTMYQDVQQAIQRSCEYLFSVQSPDGSWKDHVVSPAIATSTALCVLYYADAQSFALRLKNGCSWRPHPQQQGAVEEIAWALAALPSVRAPSDALDRAASWLMHQQQPVGCWSPNVIGYYARSWSYSSDHIANGFALRALGRYVSVCQSMSPPLSERTPFCSVGSAASCAPQ